MTPLLDRAGNGDSAAAEKLLPLVSILAVSEALDALAAEDPVCADLVKLRFFAGFSNAEAACMLGMSERTAKRTWAYARARLYEELKHRGQVDHCRSGRESVRSRIRS